MNSRTNTAGSQRPRALCVAISLFLFVSLAPLCAAREGRDPLADDLILRRELAAALLSREPERDWAALSGHKLLPGGERVSVEVSDGEGMQRTVAFKRWHAAYTVPRSAGSWLFTVERGLLRSARYWPRSDSEAWIDFHVAPEGLVRVSVRLYGAWPVWQRQAPLRPQELLSLPMDSLFERIESIVPFKYFTVYAEDFAKTRTFDAAIRASLPLRYRDDGALDERGQPVFIEDGRPQGEVPGLNCSGFVKWLVDGVIMGHGAEATRINELIKPPEARGHGFSRALEDEQDPFFGLDWARNLAIAAQMAADPLARRPALSEYEINTAPFALLDPALFSPKPEATAEGPWPWTGFASDIGFPVEGLAAILYTLALDDSDAFWLVSLNNTPKGATQRRHSHVAALVPWFSENGAFRVSVFESGTASDFAPFIRRHEGWHAYLVRIPVPRSFSPHYLRELQLPGTGLWRGGLKR